MDRIFLILCAVSVLFCAAPLVLHLWPTANLRLREERSWGGDDQRRRLIVKYVAPIYLNAGRAVTPSMIDRFMSETNGMTPRETGAKMCRMVDADFDGDTPSLPEVAHQ